MHVQQLTSRITITTANHVPTRLHALLADMKLLYLQ